MQIFFYVDSISYIKYVNFKLNNIIQKKVIKFYKLLYLTNINK